MKTFLFAHNPKKWNWVDLKKAIVNIQTLGKYTEPWRVVAHRQVKIGDRAYLLRLGAGITEKGVFGAGTIVSNPELRPHWDGSSRMIYMVDIAFDTLSEEILIPMKELREKIDYYWSIQASGLELEESKADILATIWEGRSAKSQLDEAESVFEEGDAISVISRRYERNKLAREMCLDILGATCRICGFNFKEVYGDIGADFIHIHHLEELSQKAKRSTIDPLCDLIPVCPNCHAMLHKRTPVYSPEELKALIRKKRI